MSANPAEGPELVRLFLKQFQLCDLKKGESVVLLSNAETDRVRVQAAFVATEMMEAMAFEIGLPNPFDLRRVGYQSPASAPGVMEAAKSAAYYAACAIDEAPEELAEAAAVARSYCSDAFSKCAADAIQLHGGIGFTWEHHAHLYFKRARGSATLLGAPSDHRETLAQLIGLDG